MDGDGAAGLAPDAPSPEKGAAVGATAVGVSAGAAAGAAAGGTACSPVLLPLLGRSGGADVALPVLTGRAAALGAAAAANP